MAPDGLPATVRKTPDGHTSALLAGGITGILAGDPHLAPFLAIPGKDNGFDVEGVAVHGESLSLGLRGPVLPGWAVVIELLPRIGIAPGVLELAPLDDDGARSTEPTSSTSTDSACATCARTAPATQTATLGGRRPGPATLSTLANLQ